MIALLSVLFLWMVQQSIGYSFKPSIVQHQHPHFLSQKYLISSQSFIDQTSKISSPVYKFSSLRAKANDQPASNEEKTEQSAFEKVASVGLAGVLAIAVAESIFWALGMPLAEIWYKVTTGEWIDLMTTDGQLKAAGFSFGYGGFATVILQYRVTLFAIPLVPIMEKYVVTPAKKIFGDSIDQKKKT